MIQTDSLKHVITELWLVAAAPLNRKVVRHHSVQSIPVFVLVHTPNRQTERLVGMSIHNVNVIKDTVYGVILVNQRVTPVPNIVTLMVIVNLALMGLL